MYMVFCRIMFEARERVTCVNYNYVQYTGMIACTVKGEVPRYSIRKNTHAKKPNNSIIVNSTRINSWMWIFV